MSRARGAFLKKEPHDWRVAPNFHDLARLGSPIDWEEERRRGDGIPGDGTNLAWLAVERHARGPRAERAAVRFVDATGRRRVWSFLDLGRAVRRCAGVLRALGVRRGDCVFLLLEPGPEFLAAFYGILECGGVAAPLYPSLGPEAVRSRLEIGHARLLVTRAGLLTGPMRATLAPLTHLAHVLAVEEDGWFPPGSLGFDAMLARAPEEFAVERMRPEDPALLHFTSGSSATPRAAWQDHGAGLMHELVGRVVLDLHPEDVYCCTAESGWASATACGILAPLLLGVTSVVDAVGLDPLRRLRLLEDERVTVWCTTPRAIRRLRRTDPEIVRAHDLSALRSITSTGDALSPDSVWWGKETLGVAIHDAWSQTEAGGILVANLPALDIKPGSMGLPLPGIEAFLVRHTQRGVDVLTKPEAEGELAFRTGWPSLSRTVCANGDAYERVAGEFYLTGDLVRRDRDGYLWFVARAGDVLWPAGAPVGPLEIENVLAEHPAVAEVAVVGSPGGLRGERLKAFVSLGASLTPSEELRAELLGYARARLGAGLAPSEIEFRPALPHTRRGLLLRRLLRERSARD